MGKTNGANGEKEKERARGDAVASAILVGQVDALTLEGQDVEHHMVAAFNDPSPVSVVK